ncbi:GIY-YIG nuclease family protein [Patescibacteria group bacterium]|nr:GIY-YIG nuclease family protein [Patescibacteria group bacterium]MBU4016529.1 GIY-YIG nuclease family protein [Patescibacteria group bacterium]MBU4098038.1 GIY-YIG nuclease family protein [Patescibacteria group bacterium]
MPKKYYVYIVRCADGTYYTGKTIDIPRRLLQHNGELINGARYTNTRRPVELMFYEEYLTNRFACQREWEIKQMTHADKENLIYGHNEKINNGWLHRSQKA